MPNTYGQITKDDLRAPEGQVRIIRECMDDGELKLVADYYDQRLAEKATVQLAEENDEDVFTLWNDQGKPIY